MTWSSWFDVVDRAQLFFQAGAPFSTLTHLQRDRLTDAIRIRNRIAHSSTKVRNDFNEVARRHLGLARSILTIRELPRDAVWEDSREAAPDSRVEGMLAIRHPEASLDQSLLSDRLAAETNAQTHK